jgi:Uma2 family endonuclease
MAGPLRQEKRLYTYKDYASWPEDERWEIIEGEAYSMSPAPTLDHQRYLRRLMTKFDVYLEGKTCEAFNSPCDVVLPEEGETVDTSSNTVQPDIMVVCDSNKLFENKCCVGAPDLVIEILSPSTASKDMKKKRILYERFGVKVYWIADPLHKTIMVYKHGLTGKYEAPEIYSSEDKIKVGIFTDLEIDLKVIFA